MARGEIQLVDLTKRFADVTAVDGIDLEIPGGEFFSLLGPSGCGKTTTLRLIAGFEQPTAGRILLDGTDVAYTPPHRRNVNTVFQNYALFPHLNVFDNIAFGLRRAKRPKPEIRERVGARSRAGSADRLRETKVVAALGRPATTGGACPRPRAEPDRAPPRRASGGARREAPQGSPDRAEGAPAGGRHHVSLRDPRPGGGAHDVRPPGRHERGACRPDRRPARRVRGPGNGLRGGFPRRVEPHGRRRAGHAERWRAASRSKASSSRRAEATRASSGRGRSSSDPSASSSSRTDRPPAPIGFPGMVERLVYVGAGRAGDRPRRDRGDSPGTHSEHRRRRYPTSRERPCSSTSRPTRFGSFRSRSDDETREVENDETLVTQEVIR